MKNNKGISMITLIITIIVMIILLSLAYRIGTRYISESKEEEKSALISIMSSAVEKRQKDNFVGLSDAKSYYAGYHISSGDFNLLYPLFESNESIYGPGLWYMIDAVNADDLGVVESSNYLVQDVNNVTKESGKFVAVADYYTGTVYLIKYQDIDKIDGIDIAKIASGNEGTHSPDHEPVWTVATCTEPSICRICGYVHTPALGHNYGKGENNQYSKGMEHATCTEDLKCINCGYIAEKATGHNYDTESLKYDAKGHYNTCKNIDSNNGLECGAMGNFKEHNLRYRQREGSEWVHDIYCDYEQVNGVACQYEAAGDCNIKVKPKDLVEHIRYCTECGKEATQAHDVIKYRYVDHNIHIKYCETCGTELGREEHVDEEMPFGWCDKCEGQIDTSVIPSLTVTMVKQGNDLSEDKKYVAKRGDVVEITIISNIALASTPVIKVQGQVIRSSDIENQGNTYKVTVQTARYDFEEGLLNIEVSNIKSLWGKSSETITSTSDGKYVQYDGSLPEYIYIP